MPQTTLEKIRKKIQLVTVIIVIILSCVFIIEVYLDGQDFIDSLSIAIISWIFLSIASCVAFSYLLKKLDLKIMKIERSLIKERNSLEKKVEVRTKELTGLYKESYKKERYLQTIMDNVLECIITIDVKGKILSFNKEASKVFGYDNLEVIGKNINMLMPNPYQNNHGQYIDSYFQTKKPKIIGTAGRSLEGLRKNGDIFPIKLGINKVEVNDEIIFVGMVSDQTKYVEYEKMLHQSKNKLENEVRKQTKELKEEKDLVELLQLVTVNINESKSIKEAFRICLSHICNYTKWPLGHVYEYDKREKILRSLNVWYKSDEAKYKEFILDSSDKEFQSGQGLPGVALKNRSMFRFVSDLQNEANFTRKKSADKCGLKAGITVQVIVNKNIYAIIEFYSEKAQKPNKKLIEALKTVGIQLGKAIEKRQADKAIQHAKEVAEELNNDLVIAKEEADLARVEAESANSAKSEFLANISHELRTPMHAILSFSDKGVKRFDKLSKEQLIEFFGDINTSGKRLLLLVNDLLDFSKLGAKEERFNIVENDVKEIINQAIKEMKPLSEEKGITINTKFAKSLKDNYFDENKIIQVLINLISNSIKFAKSNTKISIKAENTKKGLVVKVTDEGLGIPENELLSIFDDFVQSRKTKSGAGGTGLGLSICKRIIDGHGGKIWAQNTKNGACFTFIIPEAAKI